MQRKVTVAGTVTVCVVMNMKQRLSITKEHNILTNISLLCIGATLVSGDEVVRVLCSIKGDLEAYLNKKNMQSEKNVI